ncbi:dockerin type I repeat-containing protein [Ruminococcus sp.]|uniref:dockerin type I repeat-containing protein n=1 Tax=Ruminococcus sp. TaxID=41978 RepID=UPI0025D21D77|nr:dockerin type I repeat-containing protein [Ruminococcus sp.]MBQ8967554.1 dockerin type I repeat-containing protein [Ruminococcus sp.]
MKIKNITAALTAVSLIFGNAFMIANADLGSRILGDINGDGDINVTDVSLVAAHVKNIRGLKETVYADVNQDGDVNVTDINIIAAHVKSIRPIPPVEADTSSLPENDTSSSLNDSTSSSAENDTSGEDSGSTTENDDTSSAAHVHNWVDVTETRVIHHDAEYATRTYWDKPCFYHGCQNLTDAHLTVPGRYGDWMNYGWEESTSYMAPTFDILLWKYGTPSNFPSYVQRFHSAEECDNFFGFSGSVLFCSTNPMTGSHVPDFNPNTDIILTYDNYDLDNDAWNDLHGSAASWDFWMYNNSPDEVYPVFQEQIKVRDAWDETTTVVVGHKCSECGAVE